MRRTDWLFHRKRDDESNAETFVTAFRGRQIRVLGGIASLTDLDPVRKPERRGLAEPVTLVRY